MDVEGHPRLAASRHIMLLSTAKHIATDNTLNVVKQSKAQSNYIKSRVSSAVYLKVQSLNPFLSLALYPDAEMTMI